MRRVFNSQQKQNSHMGFTLLELLLGLGIIAIVAVPLAGILYNSLRVANREGSASDVSEGSRFVLQKIQQKVRDSSLIDMGVNATSSTLLLRLRDTSTTTIYASGTAIYITENSVDTPLTSSKVSVDSFVFTKYSNPPGKDTVQVDMTLSAVTSNPTFAFSKPFRGAISRVSAAIFDASLIPGSDNAYDVGLVSPQRWRNGNFAGGVTIGGYLTADSGSNTFYVDNINHRVGVGTTSPATLFSVATGTNIFNVNQSGSVGINTSTPAYALDVYGTLHVTQTSTISANVDVTNHKLVNLLTPTAGTDAATKAYVDAAASGCTWQNQTFTSNGTWTWASNVKEVYVYMVGGGGGGATIAGSPAAGGGSGQSLIRYPVSVSANVTVTIGSGGVDGCTGGGPGGPGGDTSFGSLTALGGSGGVGNVGGKGGSGAPAGGSSSDSLGCSAGGNSSGSAGSSCGYSGGAAGAGLGGGGGGGGSSFGNGGNGGAGSSAGVSPGANTGAGAGGGGSLFTCGGTGGSGKVIVEWCQ